MASRRRRNNTLPIGILVTLVVIAAILVAVLLILMKKEKEGNVQEDYISVSELSDDNADIEPTTYVTNVSDNSNIDINTTYGTNESVAESSYGLPEKEVDIKSLKENTNSDIYAWIYIPEAGIDEPIVQNEEDILYYTNHDYNGSENSNGAIYTQMLNSKDFTDNMTVIYGHNSGSDTGFSNLNVFKDPGYFKQYPYIYIYTENEILVYQTFAAYEFDDKHIIMFYSTNDDVLYQVYLDNIEEYAGMGGNLNKEIWPNSSDRTITLSTGIEGKDDKRLLVQAKLVATVSK